MGSYRSSAASSLYGGRCSPPLPPTPADPAAAKERLAEEQAAGIAAIECYLDRQACACTLFTSHL